MFGFEKNGFQMGDIQGECLVIVLISILYRPQNKYRCGTVLCLQKETVFKN